MVFYWEWFSFRAKLFISLKVKFQSQNLLESCVYYLGKIYPNTKQNKVTKMILFTTCKINNLIKVPLPFNLDICIQIEI